MSRRIRVRYIFSKWFIADAVDKVFRNSDWCVLVDWALQRKDDDRAKDGELAYRLKDAFASDYCRTRSTDVQGNRVCYCGKFADGKRVNR